MKTPDFSPSEEAFLLNSLHEVVKVWASGNGKATFNLKIENGSAELQIAFVLGHPHDVHAVPPRHPQHDPHHDQHLPRRRPRHKGPARREKDRARAVKHQAFLKSKKTAESADILLPFRGKILPLANEIATQETASVEQTPLASTRRQSSAVSAWTPNGAEPAQNHQTFAVNPKKPSSSLNTLTTI